MNMKQSIQYLAALLFVGAVGLLAITLGLASTRGIDLARPGLVVVLGIVGIIVLVSGLLMLLVSRKF